jgi:type I restriction enzyme S subunit
MKLKIYPKYKDSETEWIGEIPEDWEVRKLKHIAKVYSGVDKKKDGIFPIYGANGIIGYCEKPSFKKERVIIGRVGSSGEINLAKEMYGVTDNALIVDNDDRKSKTKFLFYTLNCMSFSEDISYNAQPLITASKVKEKIIQYPCIQEQIIISNFLDKKTAEIDKLIEKDKKLINLLKEKRTGLINHAVTKGLDPNVRMKDSETEWIGEIPEDWEVKKLKFTSDVYISNVDKKIHPNEDIVFLCNYIDVYKNEFITYNLEFMQSTASIEQIRKLSINREDVIITKDSETIEEIAIPALVIEDLNNIICGYHLSLIRTHKVKLRGRYLFRLFQSKIFSEQFSINANGVTRFGISTYPIKNISILLPPRQEQKNIAEYLDIHTLKIDKTIQKIEEKIKLLEEYKKSLIHHVVTGKIDVREAI